MVFVVLHGFHVVPRALFFRLVATHVLDWSSDCQVKANMIIVDCELIWQAHAVLETQLTTVTTPPRQVAPEKMEVRKLNAKRWTVKV